MFEFDQRKYTNLILIHKHMFEFDQRKYTKHYAKP